MHVGEVGVNKRRKMLRYKLERFYFMNAARFPSPFSVHRAHTMLQPPRDIASAPVLRCVPSPSASQRTTRG